MAPSGRAGNEEGGIASDGLALLSDCETEVENYNADIMTLTYMYMYTV